MHQSFHAALAAYQGEVQAARRDGRNPHLRSNYATLASVMEAIRPACKHGLSHTQTCIKRDEGVVLVTTLRHRDGYMVTSELPLTLGSDWQKFGSAFTYARRYALMGIYGIASTDDDDDGAAAAAPPQPSESRRRSEPASSPLQQRIETAIAAMNALHQADPEAIKQLVAAFRQQFKLPSGMAMARSLQDERRLSWLEQQLQPVAAPAPEAPAGAEAGES